MKKKNTISYEMFQDHLVYVAELTQKIRILEVANNQVCLLLSNGFLIQEFATGIHKYPGTSEDPGHQSGEALAFFVNLNGHDLSFGMEQPVYAGYEMIKLRALGNLRFRINDPLTFVSHFISKGGDFRRESIVKTIQEGVEQELLVFFRDYQPISDHFFDVKKVGVALKTWLNKLLAKWGLYIDVLTLKHLTVPPEVIRKFATYKPCEACHQMLPPETSICTSCGHYMANLCNQCGRIVRDKYCPDCGTPNT